MSLKRAKGANVAFTISVFGYLREHEKDESISVPAMIKYLILNYYLLKETIEEDPCAVQKDDRNVTVTNSYALEFRYGGIEIDPQDESIAEYE